MREPIMEAPSLSQPPQALLERLKDYGQEDAFALWDELSADERLHLVRDIEVNSHVHLSGSWEDWLMLQSWSANFLGNQTVNSLKDFIVDLVLLFLNLFCIAKLHHFLAKLWIFSVIMHASSLLRVWISRESIGSFGVRFDPTVSAASVHGVSECKQFWWIWCEFNYYYF